MEDGDAFRDLLGRARAGEAAARDELAAWMWSVSHAYASRQLGTALRDRLESHDIAQEAAAEALANLDEFRGDETRRLRGWLATLVGRRIGDAAKFHTRKKRDRRRQERLPSHGSRLSPVGARGDKSPSSRAAANERLSVLMDILSTYSPHERRLAELHMHGASPEEIARELGISKQAAKKRLDRLFARLESDAWKRGL